jgi:hypothetical protein
VSGSTTLSLHAVDLALVMYDWHNRPIDVIVAMLPRGRVACMLSGPIGGVVVDGRRPPAQALAMVAPEARSALFEALVEDHAMASLHDVPEGGLNAALAVLSRLAERHELALPRLREGAAAACPIDEDSDTGCVAFVVERDAVPAARLVVGDPSLRDVDLPEARIAGVDTGHIRDVLAALEPVLTALSSPDVSLIAIGSR